MGLQFLITGRIGSGQHDFLTRLLSKNLTARIVDIDDIAEIVNKHRNNSYAVIYIMALDTVQRKFDFLRGESNKLKAENAFNEKNSAENEKYTNFEKNIADIVPKNVLCIYRYVQNFNESETERYIDFIKSEHVLYTALEKIVDGNIKANVVQSKDNMIYLSDNNDPDKNRLITKDELIRILWVNGQGSPFEEFLIGYLKTHEIP